MTELGHVVFYVRNLQLSVNFYTQIVGLKVVSKIFNGKAVMLNTGRHHHELLLIEVGNQQGPLQDKRIGLYHVGWKIGESLDTLKTLAKHIRQSGYQIDSISDHTISQSIYLRDPDGNELELFVDNPDIDWRNDLSWLEAPVKPLTL